MDVSKRQWWIRVDGVEEGPVTEDDFQGKLRSGEVPLWAEIKSNFMESWSPLLTYIANDETFRRPSSLPPPPPKSQKP